jgi:aminoglycoside phosphotransferase (APT) family kinase protein
MSPFPPTGGHFIAVLLGLEKTRLQPNMNERHDATPNGGGVQPVGAMSSSQWIPDPPMTPDAAAALIGSSFPAVDSAAVRYLGSGSQFDAFATADGWAFRFPRWEWCGYIFESEARAHRLAAEMLPSQIRLPKVELIAAPTPQFPYPFAGHRFIPGVGADAVDEELLPKLAREIAILLSALHSTPAPVAGAAGIHEFVMDDDRRAWAEHGTAVAKELRGLDPVVEKAVAWLSTNPEPPPFGGPLHFIHTGLAPEHLLVDPDTGFLNGVLDWTDTMLGDPARDFVFLVTWRGWHFVEDVLRHYPHAVDRGFPTRLRYMAQQLSIMWLAFGHDLGVDPTSHIRGIRNAFAPHEGG